MSVRDLLPWRARNLEDVSSLDPFSRMHREMDRWMGDVMSGAPHTFFGPSGNGRGTLVPTLDVAEDDEKLEISVDLPGMDAKDVTLTLSEGVLSIAGERKASSEQKDRNFYRSERSYGSFARRLSLPYQVDADRIEAAFEKGVLKITLPKSPETRASEHRIEIATK